MVRIELKASADDSLLFSVFRGSTQVIAWSPLRMTVGGVEITKGVRIGPRQDYEVDETYAWRGGHSQAINRCRGAKFEIRSAAGEDRFELDVRAFDDGVAFRQILGASGTEDERTPDEDTAFQIPRDSIVWFHDLEGHYEAAYRSRLAGDFEKGQWLAPPMTFRLPDGSYGSITEAALTHYSGMALRADGKAGFHTVLGHAQPPSYPFRLRYKDDVERLSHPAGIRGEITTPWRVVLAADSLNALVNTDVIHNLSPPPDEALFPHGVETEWIKPGRAVWKYLDGGENSLEEVKRFSRWAGELGFEYQVVEGYWSRWSDQQIRDAVEYSRDQGVGLWFWRHSNQLRSAETQDEFFNRLAEYGVVGAKIDFFDHEHRDVVDLYGQLLEGAARRQIMVNFHGANKPTGEVRRWPNELMREGVRGMEARRMTSRAVHDATLPFTRYLAGHGDYTPVLFNERRGDTTEAHQIATAAAFDEPLLTYGAHPRTLLAHPAVEMIKSIPSVWDQTIVLPPSSIGDVALLARRRGHDWFLIALNGKSPRNFDAALEFLDNQPYEALIVADDPSGGDGVAISERALSNAESLPIKLAAGGGFVARLRPQLQTAKSESP